MHRRHRTDGNQTEIVEALRRCGFSVQLLSQVGGGCPDLLVGRLGANTLLEIKLPGEDLHEDQQRFHNEWRGPIAVAHTIEEALAVVSLRK